MTISSHTRYLVVHAQACHCGTGGSNKDWIGVVIRVVEAGEDEDRTPAPATPCFHFASAYGRSGGRMQGSTPGPQLNREQAYKAFRAKNAEKLRSRGYVSIPFEQRHLAAFALPLEMAPTQQAPISREESLAERDAPLAQPVSTGLGFAACRVEALSSWQPYVSSRFGATEKANGERCLLQYDGVSLAAYNRGGLPAPPVPAAAERLARLGHPFVLDGERLTTERAGHYVIFDLLRWGDMDLLSHSYRQRITLLQQICADAGLISEKKPTPTLGEAFSNSLVEGLALLTPQPGIRMVDVLTGVRKAAGEGIIIRDLSHSYGASHSVFKFKLTSDLDAIVIGIKPGAAGGSLSLGLRRPGDNAIIACGQVRSGLSTEDMRFFTEQVLAGRFPVIKVEYLPARTVGVALVEGRTNREWMRTDKTAWECTTDQLGQGRASLIAHAKAVPGIRLLPLESAPPVSGASQKPVQKTSPQAIVAPLPQSRREDQEQYQALAIGRLLPLCVESEQEYACLLDMLGRDETVLVDVRRKRSFPEPLPALTEPALRERWGMKYLCLAETLGNKHEYKNWNGACELALPEQGIAVLALLLARGMRVVLLSRKQSYGKNEPFSRQVEMILSLLEEQGIRFALDMAEGTPSKRTQT